MKELKGRSVCFFSAKGGVGKTTNLLSLAGIFEQLGKKVLVIDMDLYSGGIAAYLNRMNDKSIYHVVFETKREAMQAEYHFKRLKRKEKEQIITQGSAFLLQDILKK